MLCLRLSLIGWSWPEVRKLYLQLRVFLFIQRAPSAEGVDVEQRDVPPETTPKDE